MNIFEHLQPSAPSQRTAFDMNARHLYSQKVGQDNPVWCLDMLPKDYAEIDVLSLVRTLPINTSAYARMKARFQFIFVPYQQLWHGWNQFFLQSQENMSIGSSFSHDALPRADFQELLDVLLWDEYYYRLTLAGLNDDVVDPEHEVDDDDMPNARMNWLIRNHYADDNGYAVSQNALRLLDMLGYGSFYGYAQAAKGIAEWRTLPFSREQAMRTLIEETTELYANKYVNFFRILAYHKAWQDYFMNKRVQAYDPVYFNVDDLDVIYLDKESFKRYFTLHYHPWSYDLVSGLYTSPQDGDVSLITGSGTQQYFKLQARVNTSGIDNPVTVQNSTHLVNNAGNTEFKMVPNTGISVYDIKRAEFLQNWKENKLRAGYKLQNQARAQWNARFKYLSDEYSEYVNETIMNISIDEVINTAENQGDISGKGIGTSSGKFTFQTEDAGVLICICSVTPNQEYNSNMIDKQNTVIEPTDFPNPFFDKLGFEAIPRYLVKFFHDRSNVSGQQFFESILGYAPRYAPWKTALDKVHGEFQNTGHLSEIEAGQTRFNYKFKAAGSLSAWSLPRNDIFDYVDYSLVPQRQYYISPEIADTIFAANSDSDQTSDHFLFNTNFVVKVVRQLSGLGLPNWQS